jgi:hypothetical protein
VKRVASLFRTPSRLPEKGRGAPCFKLSGTARGDPVIAGQRSLSSVNWRNVKELSAS